MTIAFFSNFINHHQKLVADEIYRLIGADYTFVEIMPMPESFRKNGYPDYSSEPYVLRAWENKENEDVARELALSVDVAMFDSVLTIEYETLRAKTHPQKLSFEVSERWLKKGAFNLLSPRLILWVIKYHTLFKKSNCYKLCSSAYVPNDMRVLSAFKEKCLKWGYFTRTQDIIAAVEEKSVEKNDVVSMMWCARFLEWKHPELPILLAKRLKDEGYKFRIDMFGEGKKKKKIEQLVKMTGVGDVVQFKGVLPNKEILASMRQHDIFLFTSDRNEGWGAVLNEAMSSGCAVVSSDEIGATPYLVRDGENGLIFRSKSLDSLYEKVVTLLRDDNLRQRLGKQAKEDLQTIWSPQSATNNLFQCINDIQRLGKTTIEYGPCSQALPV